MRTLRYILFVFVVLGSLGVLAQHETYLSFDGTNDYISIDMQYTGTNAIPALTVEAWVRTSYQGGGYNGNWAIVDFDRSEFYDLYVRGDNGRVGFSTYGGNVHDFQGNSIVNDGEWHHIAAVYDGTNKYIYVDGVLDATSANPHGGIALGKNSTRFGIIGDGSESTSYNGGRNKIYYEGDLSEVRIWHAVKNESELQASLAPQSLTGNEANLEAYYTFQNGVVKDLTGNGHDGGLFGPTLIGGPVLPLVSFEASEGITIAGSNQVTSWVSENGMLSTDQAKADQMPLMDEINGKPAVVFDGVDDFIHLPDLTGLNTGGPFLSKTLIFVFQTGSDITNRQMLYEQGGGTRGISAYIEAEELHLTAWNLAETQWGPLATTTSIAVNKTYVATLIMDAGSGTLKAFINNELVDTINGVSTLYAHGDDGALGGVVGSTRFAGGGTAANFGGKIASWRTYNEALSDYDRTEIETRLMHKYLSLEEIEPDPVQVDAAISQTGYFNGNISAIRWNTVDELSSQVYTFDYDGLNRLSSAQFASKGSGSDYDQNRGHYSVPNISYDLNGNILEMTRQGMNVTNGIDIIDELSYSYAKGNQLQSVYDTRGSAGFIDKNKSDKDYAYDANGNMTRDLNKEITHIQYNHLNLPIKVVFNNTGDSITYLYDAAGIKLKQVVFKAGEADKTTYYMGEYIYEDAYDGAGPKLQLIQHEEGRVVPKYETDEETINDFDYQYHLKDHLGNVRVTFSTTPENYIIDATMEQGAEAENFSNYVAEQDAVASHSGTHVSRNSNHVNGGLDLNTMLSLNKHDTVRISAYAFYTASNSSFDLASGMIETALFGAYGGNYGLEGTTLSQTNIDNAFAGGTVMGSKTSELEAPPAYLNYLYFDREMNYVHAGFKQITTASYNTSAQIVADDFIADQDGYLMIYLSNETQGAEVIVSWDDLKVYHGKTNIVSTQDYYPFGLTFNSYERTASVKNFMNTFQDQEYEEETGWVKFKWRNHQPDIGRFFNVDPLASDYVHNSPYAFSENKVTGHVELEGLESFPALNTARRIINSANEKMNQANVSAPEKEVIAKNPVAGYKSRKNYIKSYNLSNALTKQGTLTGNSEGAGNALRHSLWSALNTQTGGEDFARDIGEAHEEGHPDDSKTEAKVDLDNNELGISIGLDNPDASFEDLAKMIIEAIGNGDALFYNKANDSSQKSTLSKEEQSDSNEAVDTTYIDDDEIHEDGNS